jgi:hypothetical protein
MEERELDRSTLPNIDIKNEWSYTSTPHIYLHGANRAASPFHSLLQRILRESDFMFSSQNLLILLLQYGLFLTHHILRIMFQLLNRLQAAATP